MGPVDRADSSAAPRCADPAPASSARTTALLAVAGGSASAVAVWAAGRDALTLIVLNPLLLQQVVSAAHFEGVMCAFLLAALVAADRHRWTLAILFGCLAGSVKAPAFLAVSAIIVVHVHVHARATVRHGRADWRLAARDLVVAALSTGVLALTVGNGFGWIHALQTPAKGYTRMAPTSVPANLLEQIVHPDTFADVETFARYAGLFTAACLVAYLLATARNRPLNHTVGAGLVAAGLLSPVVYPWYLLWGMACLLPTLRRPGRDWLLLATGVGLVTSVVGMPAITQNIAVAAVTVVGVALLVPRTARAARTPLTG